MQKTISFCLAFLAVLTLHSQITPPFSIPDSIPEYNGSYEDFGQNHFFYPNDGEVRYDDEYRSTSVEEVAFYTKYAWPQQYLLKNNNISFVFSKHQSTSSGTVDSLHRVDIEMDRGNTSAFLARVDTQNTCILNYFTQYFGTVGRTDVRGGASIAVQNIYTNIDMVYTSNITGLKIYYIVYPGGDPNDIVLHIKGSKSNAIVGNNLMIDGNWDGIKFVKPKMYQYSLAGNVVTPLTVCNASWQNSGSDRYKISNGTAYNTALPLIIQVSQGPAPPPPSLITGLKWSTYFGSTQWDFINKSHFDANNNLYVGGQTASPNFPASSGAFQNQVNSIDGFISKFNSLGQLLWSTYVGGSNDEEIFDFDFLGADIYCVGKTGSTNLTTQSKGGTSFYDASHGGGVYDGFILQIGFNGFGIMLKNWLTYFGGNGEDLLRACKFDNSGNLFVVGSSASTNLSTIGSGAMHQQSFNSAQLSQSTLPVSDAIITRFDAGTSAQSWFTFYGSDALGTNAHSLAADIFYGLDFYGTELFACGKAGGTNLPNCVNSKLVAGNYDGILVNFTTGGVLGNAKFTNGNLVNYAVKANSGLVYTVGQANNVMSTVNSGSYYYDGTCASGDLDACFSVHSLNLSSTSHNTFLGGSSAEAAFDLRIGTNYMYYVAGGTWSNDFPTTNLANMYFNSTSIGSIDNFVSAFGIGNTNMAWSTYLGSPNQETQNLPYGGTSIALTSANVLHLSGCSASFNTFPLDNGAGVPFFQPQNASTNIGSTGTITRFDMLGMNTYVGLKDFPNTSFSFGLYPNPTTSYLKIDNIELANQDLRFAIYDLTGKKLSEGRLESKLESNIDVSFLPEGVYIVNVSNGSKTLSNKFIKTDN